MVLALFLDCGLATLAAIYATTQILGQLTMVALAYHACPGLRLKRSLVDMDTIKELYIYSGKALLPTFAEMLLNQTTSVLIAGNLGLASLAIFTRPRSLLRQMDSLERKMAMILVPTTSSLESCGNLREIESLFVKSVRYSLCLVLPLVLVLVIFGDEVMRLWMGSDYAIWILPAVMATGFLGTCIQTPILCMLEGLNAHGRAGLGQFVGSVLSAVAVFVALQFFHGTLTLAALAVTIPLLSVNLVYLPMLSCRRLQKSFAKFYAEVAIPPLIYVAPFALCLMMGRLLFREHPVASLGLCALGGFILAAIYWRYVLPARLKTSLRRNFGKMVAFLR
jgi:O-antigen/teichoic acid export membrane protein